MNQEEAAASAAPTKAGPRRREGGHPRRRRLELLGGGADVGLALAAGLLGQQRLVDVGQHPSGGDGDGAEQLAELLVVARGELDVARHDPVLLVVARRVAGELQHLRLGGGILISERRGEGTLGRNGERQAGDPVGKGKGRYTSAARYSRTAAR